MIHRRNIMCQHVRETAGLLVLAAGWADALEVGEAGEVQPLALRARPPAALSSGRQQRHGKIDLGMWRRAAATVALRPGVGSGCRLALALA